ncbi:MAG: hypothetical protein JWO08_3251 [Verrucomicrobiaceae bacterium]|nr:hypothetical protein [Verrucomicrobiaceae bacterium]
MWITDMPEIDTTAAAFLAGLVTSLHCLGMCGPLACSWAVARGSDWTFMRDTALYHTSRLTAYSIVGALAGALGRAPLAWFQHGGGVLLPWLLVLVFAVVGLGLDARMPKPLLLTRPMTRIRFKAMKMGSMARASLIGLATPLLPCGPLYMMFGLALANGSAARGAEFSAAFGLGTLPLLALGQTQLHRLGIKLSPVGLKRLQRGMALMAAVVLAWRLRGSLGFGDIEQGCCQETAMG